MYLSGKKFVGFSFKRPLTSIREVPKTEAMQREDFSDGQHFATIKDGEWHFRNRRGRVDASVPITSLPFFSELAVLVDPDDGTWRYAARLDDTDHWAYFHNLQTWMYPLVSEFLTTQARYEAVTELVAKAHRLAESRRSQ